MTEEEWIRAHVAPTGAIEVTHDYPWSTVSRVPVGDDAVWFKQCKESQMFEVPLTAALASRWPDRLAPLLAADVERSWLLLGDAGTPLRALGNALDAWLVALPLYAELQQGETAHAAEHLAAGAPDQRVEGLPAAFDAFAEREPRLRPFAGWFHEQCARLTLPPTVQHDDLHAANVFAKDGRVRLLDWGDTVIGHPFVTMVVTMRQNDADAERLRDAYLDAWSPPARAEFAAARRVGGFTRILSWQRIATTTGDPAAFAALERNVEWFLENAVDA